MSQHESPRPAKRFQRAAEILGLASTAIGLVKTVQEVSAGLSLVKVLDFFYQVGNVASATLAVALLALGVLLVLSFFVPNLGQLLTARFDIWFCAACVLGGLAWAFLGQYDVGRTPGLVLGGVILLALVSEGVIYCLRESAPTKQEN